MDGAPDLLVGEQTIRNLGIVIVTIIIIAFSVLWLLDPPFPHKSLFRVTLFSKSLPFPQNCPRKRL